MILVPSPEQAAALQALRTFLVDREACTFVLRGSAGTGKTSMVGALVFMLEEMGLSHVLLAPTGRAARILGNKVSEVTKSAIQSGTVHGMIYQFGSLEVFEDAVDANDPGMRMYFPLRTDEPTVDVLIVDEASMLGDLESRGDSLRFGSGRLLSDLVQYARLRRHGRAAHDHVTKLILVGDPAQLPPVGESGSPALSDAYLRDQFGLTVSSFDLHQVQRQAAGSAILQRSSALREALEARRFNSFSLAPHEGEIREVESDNVPDLMVHGLLNRSSCVTIVHSNAAALEYNQLIRERLWGMQEAPMREGDRLLVNRNTGGNLSNGDLVKVISVAERAEVHTIGLRGAKEPVILSFRNAEVAFRDAEDQVVLEQHLVLENLLDSPKRGLSALEQRALLVHFIQRHPHLKRKSAEFRKQLLVDPYFNALQVKYGYAMTCHKAQGGEWVTAIVDFSHNRGWRSADFFRWTYTAITRAKQELVVINAPAFTATSDLEWAPTRVSLPPDAAASAPSPESDADWQRHAFTAATAPLFTFHQKLRAAWQAQGIEVLELQHQQFCERYTLARDGESAVVQYHYDKKHRMTRCTLGPATRADQPLAQEALACMQRLANRSASSAGAQPSFVDEFLARLERALSQSELKLKRHKLLPWRLRVTVGDDAQQADIDFIFDRKERWTQAQEVGGPGASGGLYEQVQYLLESGQEPLP